MKKVIYISYAVCAIAMFALLFYMFDHLRAVSYTHLTLPTKLEV